MARKAELTVRLPGVRIAPAMSTWTCSKTRSEKSGAKGAKTRIIMVGRVRIKFTSFDGSVTSLPYPLFLKMAKVQLRRSSARPRSNSPDLALRAGRHCAVPRQDVSYGGRLDRRGRQAQN